MLVIHPSSRCDVCLDSYTWETPAQTPHAIPCGHIFCKTCLRAVIPSNCPLCRKTFVADRAKKLHVDRPENLEEERDLDLLQRLSLAWDTPEDHIVQLTDEVESWLRTRREDSSAPLRKAREALGKYQQLKEKRDQDRKKIKTLEQTLRHREQNAAVDKDTTKAVEQSLLAQVESLTTKLNECESEVAGLRSELARFQHTSNPLPPPPEPIPLDRFPSFATAAASYSSSVSNENENDSQSPDGTEQDAPSSAGPYVNGYPAYFVGNPVSTDPDASAELRAPAFEAREVREREASLHRKGKEKKPMYNFYRYPTAQNDAGINNDRQRNGIIPGASPNQRVIPSPTVMNGELRREGINMWTPDVGNDGGLSSRQVNGMDETKPIDLGLNDVVDPSAPATAYVSGYSTGYGYGFQYAHGYTPLGSAVYQPFVPDQMQNRGQGFSNMSSLASALPDNQDQGNGSLGLLGVPPPVSALPPERERGFGSSRLPTLSSGFQANDRHWQRSSGTSRTRRRASTRRSTTDGYMTDSASAGPSSQPIRRRRNRRSTQDVDLGTGDVRAAAGAGSPRTGTERNSVSSWGTVPTTARNAHDSSSSIADLGLLTFPHRAGTPISDISLDNVNTPRVANTGLYTPEIGPVSRLLGIDPGQRNMQVGVTNENRPRHQQLSSHPTSSTQQIVANPGSSNTQTNAAAEGRPFHPPFSLVQDVSTQSQRRDRLPRGTRANHHHDGSRRYSSSVIPGRDTSGHDAIVSFSSPDITANLGYVTEPPSTPNFGNALGLDLSQSPDQSGLPITAPTPIVSHHNFLRQHS